MTIETPLGDTDRWWEVQQVQPKDEKVELELKKVKKVELGLKKVEMVRRKHQALLGHGLSKQSETKEGNIIKCAN